MIGAEIRIGNDPLLLYVESTKGYQNLCRLLSEHAETAVADESSVAARQRSPFHNVLISMAALKD